VAVQEAVIAVMVTGAAGGCFNGVGLAGFAWKRPRLILRMPGCSGIFSPSVDESSRAGSPGTACGISVN